MGLGIARSLGRRGIPVCVLDDEYSITRFSRYTSHASRVPDLRQGEAVAAALLGLGTRLRLDGWVLYPTRDEIVAGIAQNKRRLGEIYRVPVPDWKTVQYALDKRRTYELAAELLIPTPRTWHPRTIDDLRQIDAEPPFAVKPAIKDQFIYATGAKAWRADNVAELERLFTRAGGIVEKDQVMVQELIPGDGSFQFAYGAFFRDGQSVGSMVARRRRQHPPEFGRATTFAETVEVPVLRRRSERLLRHIRYYGLAELEYKLDPRDGEYKLLDFNPRAWGYHALGGRAGVDFPLLLFEDQLGHEVATRQARTGVHWVRLTTDLPTALLEMRAGRLRFGELVRALRRDASADAVFSRQDPAPGLAEVLMIPYLAWKRGF